MKRNPFRIFLPALFFGLLAPVSFVYAITANQDVTLVIPKDAGGTSNVTLQSGGTFGSLTVNSTNLTITLSGGQTVTLSASDKLNYTVSPSQDANFTCATSLSLLTLSPASETTYTITMGGSCTTSTPGTTTSSSSGGGGGTAGSITTLVSPSVTPQQPPATVNQPPVSQVSSPTSVTPSADLPKTELELGMEGPEVVKLQKLLAKYPDIYPSDKVTGYFGKLTKTGVKKFQAKHGLSQVGRVGPATLAKLIEIFGSTSLAEAPNTQSQVGDKFKRELEMGMEGEDVAALQMFLLQYPDIYPNGKVTGYYGALTRAAVRKFQTKYGFPPVGRVGPMTLKKLNELSR